MSSVLSPLPPSIPASTHSPPPSPRHYSLPSPFIFHSQCPPLCPPSEWAFFPTRHADDCQSCPSFSTGITCGTSTETQFQTRGSLSHIGIGGKPVYGIFRGNFKWCGRSLPPPGHFRTRLPAAEGACAPMGSARNHEPTTEGRLSHHRAMPWLGDRVGTARESFNMNEFIYWL